MTWPWHHPHRTVKIDNVSQSTTSFMYSFECIYYYMDTFPWIVHVTMLA
jgi:hypothetical protein